MPSLESHPERVFPTRLLRFFVIGLYRTILNYIEIALISIVAIWMLALTAVVYKFYRTRNIIISMASKWARHMGKASGAARQETAQAKHLASGQAKIVDTLATQIPGAAGLLKTSGVSDNEAWALITDQNTLKGLKVLMDTFGGAAKWLTDRADKPKKRGRKGTGDAPLLEYKAT